MSKLSKLLNHPIQFWVDALRNGAGLGSTHNEGIQCSVGLDPANLTDPIALYFAGGQAHIYQLRQWVAPLKALQQSDFPVSIICRTLEAFNWTTENTPFKAFYCKTMDNLLCLYKINPFKCILYVNNSYRNFQSLINARALHVHINHGESEKISTFSNQTKAYDYVLVSGVAALEKYDLNLMKKDLSRYLLIGRPQIEHIRSVPNPFANFTQSVMTSDISAKTVTVLYAPTWEGAYEEMNYSSVVSIGLNLVRTLLSNPTYRLIYRPHPNTGKRLQDYHRANLNIIQFVQRHSRGRVQSDCDINALFPHVDVAIFDNSAVAVDYLAVNKPMLLTRWQDKTKNQNNQSAITQASRVIGPEHILQLPELLSMDVHEDLLATKRQWARNYYLGQFDYAQQASTCQFIRVVAKICAEREVLQSQLKDRAYSSNLGIS